MPRSLVFLGLVLGSTAFSAHAADWWQEMPVPTIGTTHIDVTSMGALGNGVHDDTAAFQSAIDALPSDGGVIDVPPGTYMIDATHTSCPGRGTALQCGLILRSHVALSMDVGAVLKVIPNDQERHYAIYVRGQSDVEIVGGRLVGDRTGHLGNTGEHGYGIAIAGSTNVRVRWTEVSNFWGDGFIVSRTGGDTNPIYSRYVTLDHVKSSNNRRQGLTVAGGVQYLLVQYSTFRNSNGTAPEAGVDFEPDQPTVAPVSDIRLYDNTLTGNAGNGIEIQNGMTNLSFVGNDMSANGGFGLFANATSFLTVKSNTLDSNALQGVRIAGTSHDVTLQDNQFTCNYTLTWGDNCTGGAGQGRNLVFGANVDMATVYMSGNTFTPAN
jgi:hypothetical protein